MVKIKIAKKTIFFPLLFLMLSCLAVYFLPGKYRFSDDKENKVIVNNKEFTIEIADNDREKNLGLGKRKDLCEDCGMLFVFPRSGIYSFWMKDMLFPLDIIWIRENKAVYVARDVSPEYRGNINSGMEADSVLEINSGLSEKYGIEKGSDFIFR